MFKRMQAQSTVRYSMRKGNLATCTVQFHKFHFSVHTRCHAVLHVENPISPRANINLHVTRHGYWISPRGIVYTTRDLSMEACCTIHENDY